MSDNQQSGGFRGDKGNQQLGGQKQMFAATCADCHKQCEVPFQPVGDKPVYCKECFNKRREGAPRDTLRPNAPSGNTPKQNFTSNKPQAAPALRLEDLKCQMDVMNSKLDTLLQKFEGGGSKSRNSVAKKVSAKKSRKVTKSSKK